MNEPNKSLFETMRKACLLGALAAFGQAATAGEAAMPYVMTVISDQAQGEQVVRGHYNEAIRQITSATNTNRFAASNNLCVAYTKVNKLADAERACLDALKRSRSTFMSWYDIAKKTDHAVALSNLGVIRAVSGDSARARKDFREAVRLTRSLAAPAENLATLEAKMTTEAVLARE
jgi:tetratricopeptide (TPR) repeat protein